jgi:hypothetical protein
MEYQGWLRPNRRPRWNLEVKVKLTEMFLGTHEIELRVPGRNN